MNERDLVIPRANEETIQAEEAGQGEAASTVQENPPMTQAEADQREKVYFEEDEKVRLRDGFTYSIPPLGLKDARQLIQKLNTIDSGVIIANLIPEGEEEEDRFDELMEILHMAFKPYYKHITVEYLEEFIDLDTAKTIIDCMIGLNGLKKSL